MQASITQASISHWTVLCCFWQPSIVGLRCTTMPYVGMAECVLNPGVLWQGGIEGLDIQEPDEAELEAPTIDHTWTIKVSAQLDGGFPVYVHTGAIPVISQ